MQPVLRILIASAAGLLALHAEDGLDLRGALEQALRAHPALTASREQASGARHMIVQAGLRPNPRLLLQSENARAWGGTGFAYGREADTYAYLSQIVETAGKRARRVELAAASAERVQAESEALRRQVAARVALAYWSAVGAERSRDLLRQEQANLARMVDYTGARVAEGAAPGADRLRIDLEYRRVEALFQAAAQEAVNARIQLFREMGAEQDSGARLTDALDRLAPSDFPELNDALRRRPEILAAQRGVEQACANVKLQQANAHPDLDVIAGYKRTFGFNTVIAGVQVPLALFHRNQGQIGAATAEANAAGAALRSVENQVRADWAAARNQYNLRRAQAFDSLPQLVQRAAELARIAEASYREGAVDVLRLLDAQRTSIEAQLQYTRALLDYQQSVVNFKVASGVNP